MHETDTIAALATAPGTGGIAIVRISGPDAEKLLSALFTPARKWESHRLYYGHAVYQGETLDECMAVLMRAPRSYTREDVAEIHLHGGDWAARSVLSALYALGARAAGAGEFTRRAFLNGRIDLSRAEAVMALISAEGGRAARAAVRQLSGGVSAFIKGAQEELITILSGVAAAIDYPEEISFEEAAGSLESGARALAQKLEAACDERGARIAEQGLEVVLCGRPNVGKSSLLNAISRQERAIVTDIPGTTRDIIRADVMLSGIRVHFSDTAGIREHTDAIETIGVARARQAIAGADVVIVVLDASRKLTKEDQELLSQVEGIPSIIVLNKGDLPMQLSPSDFKDAIVLSAAQGMGLEALEQRILSFAAGAGESALTQARHMALARQAARSLYQAANACQMGEAVDMAAVDLHDALDALGRITGDQVDERLIDDIFSRFCVGK
ncbi:MAG: tRNA uridine-5-carboxymethylaminomethyl(34) synthesis GTPase MnmE [Clostridiales bacterium]|nr:tRNA uridine-5-carboxymethylaminomethyl(34) synthesis GTPase MnmE [Clostridiales bacterium]